MANSSDATHAYRGYRLQTLYTLSRILLDTNITDKVFQPEFLEDLTILNLQDEPVEVIQVKSYRGSNLSLTSFGPEKEGSFFYRALDLLKTTPEPIIKIVSFEDAGPELQKALESDGHEREQAASKLSSYGKMSLTEANNLLEKIELVRVDETTLANQIHERLAQMLTGTEPEIAFDFLNFWLYLCAENKTKLTKTAITERLENIGKYLAQRSAYHKEWFTSIVPIQDITLTPDQQSDLAHEYYQGISARYEHILASLDVRRERWLNEIEARFRVNRVVIVSGASGQGKTSLAYRFFYEFLPQYWRFQIQVIENKQHSTSIALALLAHADAINIPLFVYIDVAPTNTDWPDLVKQLSVHQNIRILVTIREEDYKRSAGAPGVDFTFSEIGLNFGRLEANEIYESLSQKQRGFRFLNFDEAWATFDEGGPLLEFTYLLTEGTSLKNRLQQQITHIQNEIIGSKRSPDDLKLLRLVAVAGANHARLKLGPLLQSLSLPVPQRSLELLEKEYLIRRADNGSLVEGLHPIRSALLASLLIDETITPWLESAKACLPLVDERDIGIFLLYAFLEHETDSKELIKTLNTYQPVTWVGIAGVIQSLLWQGVKEYINANEALLQDLYKSEGHKGIFNIDFDISNTSPKAIEAMKELVEQIAPEDFKTQIENYQSRQTPKHTAFIIVKIWLTKRTLEPQLPTDEDGWMFAAESLFWVGWLKESWPVDTWLPEEMLDDLIDTMPLVPLADLITALFYSYPKEKFKKWLDKNRNKLLVRFQQETQSFSIEDDGQRIITHFLIPYDLLLNLEVRSLHLKNKDISGELHQEVLMRVGLLRKLFPDRESFGGQGYGHLNWTSNLGYDPTTKTGIDISYLPLAWPVTLNAAFRELAIKFYRPTNWTGYATAILEFRKLVRDAFAYLAQCLENYFKKSGKTLVSDEGLDLQRWLDYEEQVRQIPLLPTTAFDRWGFVDAFDTNPELSGSLAVLPLLTSNPKIGVSQAASSLVANKKLFLLSYRNLVNTLNTYGRGLSSFFPQSSHTIMINSFTGKGEYSSLSAEQKSKFIEQNNLNRNFLRLSIINLTIVLTTLPQLQKEFRNLLGHLANDEELTILEKTEWDTLIKTWGLWYWFYTKPNKTFKNPARNSAKIIIEPINQARKKIYEALSSVNLGGSKAYILSEQVLWDNKTALWIALDGSAPADVYKLINNLAIAIRRVLVKTHFQNAELRNFAFDIYWSSIIIVPLVKGKLLLNSIWERKSNILLNFTDKEFAFVNNLLSEDQLQSLGLEKWLVNDVKLGQDLLNLLTKFSVLINHFKDFNGLEVSNSTGREILKNYFEGLNSELIEILENTLLVITDFLLLSPSFEDSQKIETITEELKEVLTQMRHSTLFSMEIMSDTTKLGDYVSKLGRFHDGVLSCYVYWAVTLTFNAETGNRR